MEEAAEVEAIIAVVVGSGGADAEQHYSRYKAIVTKYQEQPQLLDGCLEAIVHPLAVLLRRAALDTAATTTTQGGGVPDAQEDTHIVQGVCRLLHVLVSVRGYKVVVRFFPHEASDLEGVLKVLRCVTAAAKAASAAGSSSSGLWEAQAVLLLWLSILVLIPFDLVILDSSVTDAAAAGRSGRRGYPPLAASIMELCQDFLSQPGAVREMAALLLARLLTRPDMPAALADFLAWQQTALAQTTSGPAAVFLLPGVLQTLAQVYKLGRREQLLQLAPAVWQQLAALLADDAASGLASNALARKLAVKLAQRIGLVMLPPQLAGWRYAQPVTDLCTNLVAAAAAAGGAAGAAAAEKASAAAAAAAAGAAAADAAAAAAELPEVAVEVEDVLGVLLGSCSDRDTVVRWSAAKGVGRMAACLPQELAGEVVQGVLGLLSPAEPDTSWHGGCLAVAELARRSILCPEVLPQVAALLGAALAYDVRRGPHSVGAHVRDAAAYVCWALARSYAPQELAACLGPLAAGLLVVACYDREVNCRRAAAAAFQECVGRLDGAVPHGLDILPVADYFSVGSLRAAYLRVAPFVAQFSEYRQALLDHLLHVKLRHWDRQVRALAAVGLAALAPVAGKQLAAHALPQLLRLVTDDVLEVRCGAVLGIAELLPALAAAQQQQQQLLLLQDSVAVGTVAVLQRLEAAASYRGKGGELMREMAARLLQQLAAVAGGLVVPALCGSGISLCSKRQHAELKLQGQHCAAQTLQDAAPTAPVGTQHQHQHCSTNSSAGTRAAAGDADADDASSGGSDDADDDDAEEGEPPQAASRRQQQQQPRLALPLTPEYHAAAVKLLLDCCSHAQSSIQAAGVAALQAHTHAFQHSQPQQLLAVVQQLSSRLQGRESQAAARRGAAAALGVLPAQLVGKQACSVLSMLAGGVQAPLDPAAGADIETRIAAVTALAQLSQELLMCSSSQAEAGAAAKEGCSAALGQDGSEGRPVLPAPFLRAVVMPVLLSGLADYSRDNRGDVGSWVREAAMDGLTQLLLLLGRLTRQQPDTAAQLSPAGELQQLHRELALQLVSGLLQQSLERIARLRETALMSLQAILSQPATAAVVPGAAAIAAALPADAAELAGVASLAVVPRVAGLMQLPCYRPHVLEGLVASIGGVDASLAKAASVALLEQLAADEVAPAGAGRLQHDVAALLLRLWQQEAGSARLALPLIKTAALLITHADLAGVRISLDPSGACAAAGAAGERSDTMTPPDSADKCAAGSPLAPGSFAHGVLQQLKLELKGCGDVARLLEGAALLAQLAVVPDCSSSAVQTVMVMLVNRYPKVRRAMAEQLYLQLLAVQAEAELSADAAAAGEGAPEHAAACGSSNSTSSMFAALPADDLEGALDVLLVSAWDGPLDAVRASREQLADLLRVEIKTRRVQRVLAPGDGAKAMAAAAAGGGESYQSLLDDAARGGGY